MTRLLKFFAEGNFISLLTASFIIFFFILFGFLVNQHFDINNYYRYAHHFWRGSSLIKPFHLLPPEYPIGSLLFFSLPAFLERALYDYAFFIILTSLTIFLYWYLYEVKSYKASLAYLLYIITGAWIYLCTRFDLYPTILTFLSFTLAIKKKFNLSYLLLALAILTKVYPLPLLGAIFIFEQQSFKKNLPWIKRLNGLLVLFLSTFLLLSLSFLISLPETLSPLSFLFHRPFQVESLGASLLWLGSFIFHYPVCFDIKYSSLNIYQEINGQCGSSLKEPLNYLANHLSFVLTILGIIGSLYVLSKQLSKKISFEKSFLSILLLIILTGKVFILIWILPFICYIFELQPVLLISFFLVFGLSVINHPFIYHLTHFYHYQLYPANLIPGVAFVKNLLFTMVSLRYIFNNSGGKQNSKVPS